MLETESAVTYRFPFHYFMYWLSFLSLLNGSLSQPFWSLMGLSSSLSEWSITTRTTNNGALVQFFLLILDIFVLKRPVYPDGGLCFGLYSFSYHYSFFNVRNGLEAIGMFSTGSCSIRSNKYVQNNFWKCLGWVQLCWWNYHNLCSCWNRIGWFWHAFDPLAGTNLTVNVPVWTWP